MAKFDFEKLSANLPDAFRRSPDSNNYKLLQVEKYIIDAVNDVLTSVFDILDIDNAKGVVLDMYGAKHQVPRGKSTDKQYLLRIKSKIARSLCEGDRNSVADAVAYILSADATQVQIRSGAETGTAELVDIPLHLLIEANVSPSEIDDLLGVLLPEGVRLTGTQYSGTFEFSDTDDDYDADAGFADISGTIGGYFGLLSKEALQEV